MTGPRRAGEAAQQGRDKQVAVAAVDRLPAAHGLDKRERCSATCFINIRPIPFTSPGPPPSRPCALMLRRPDPRFSLARRAQAVQLRRQDDDVHRPQAQSRPPRLRSGNLNRSLILRFWNGLCYGLGERGRGRVLLVPDPERPQLWFPRKTGQAQTSPS